MARQAGYRALVEAFETDRSPSDDDAGRLGRRGRRR